MDDPVRRWRPTLSHVDRAHGWRHGVSGVYGTGSTSVEAVGQHEDLLAVDHALACQVRRTE
jgi:hypothetical protein